MYSFLSYLFCFLVVISSVDAAAVRVGTIPRKAPPKIGVKRAIVVDYMSGRVLFEKNSRQHCAVASTQKLLTALCVIDAGNLQKKFRVTRYDTQVVPTKVGIRPGQVYTRRKLLGALLVKSGNDIARALAHSVAGNESRFAVLMNKKARRLGMRHSHFVNPHGLTPKGQLQYSTARDMAICARAAFKNPIIRGIVQTKGYHFRFSNGRVKYLKNTNRLLRRVSYCNGMKTGTTKAAGRCLIASGTLNGRTAIVCCYGGTSSNIWRDSERLLRWALERPASRKIN